MEKLPELTERIQQIIELHGKRSKKNFAALIGVPHYKIDRLFRLDGRTGKYPMPATEVMQAIINRYDTINAVWLLTGKGAMQENAGLPPLQSANDMGSFNCMEILRSNATTIDRITSENEEFRREVKELQNEKEALRRQIDKLQKVQPNEQKGISGKSNAEGRRNPGQVGRQTAK